MREHEISPVPREARQFQGHPAGIVTRVIANTVDGVVVMLVIGAGYVGWAGALFVVDPRSFSFPSVSLLFSFTVGALVSVAYLWLGWWFAARTVGGQVMGLRVHGRYGRRLGPLRSLARAGFCVIFPVGLFWCVLSPERRSVQDLVLWTTVVYDWRPDSGNRSEGEVNPPGGR